MKRPPKHLRCAVCKRYCDLRTRGTFEVAGRRYHVRCALTTPATPRRMTPEAALLLFGLRIT